MKACLVFVLIILTSFVSSFCENGNIDINSASIEELIKLDGIGETKAQAIIDNRNYSSVEDLINVPGIGPATLEKIKKQNLACVEEIEEKEIDKTNNLEKEIQEEMKKEIAFLEKNDTLEIIDLNPKTIKIEENTKDNKTYAKYSLILFCVILIVLFLLKPKEKKNEFT